MPTNQVVQHAALPQVSFREGPYTLAPTGTNYGEVDAGSGVVGYINPTGTNPVVVAGNEPSFSGGGLRGVVEDTNVVVDWYVVETNTIWWSPDLVNWLPLTATGMEHFAVCQPKWPQAFFTTGQ